MTTAPNFVRGFHRIAADATYINCPVSRQLFNGYTWPGVERMALRVVVV